MTHASPGNHVFDGVSGTQDRHSQPPGVTMRPFAKFVWTLVQCEFTLVVTCSPTAYLNQKIAENFNRLSRVHQRHRQTDETAIAYSEREREREFTFAKTVARLGNEYPVFCQSGTSTQFLKLLMLYMVTL